MAVLLNGITTIAGFGSLMAARHQGMFGLGLLLTVGAAVTIMATLPVVALPLLLAPVDQAEAGEPTDQVQAAITELYRVLSPPAGVADRQRDEAATRIMDRLFDWKAMARSSLQQHWEARTPAEREEFTKLFSDLFRQAYVARIFVVDASGFRYLGDRITGDQATVDTRVATTRGSMINVTYVTRRSSDARWRVEDVRVEGMSLLENYRSQFSSVIQRSSYEDLVKRLRERVRGQG